jgi:hypothetical protein
MPLTEINVTNSPPVFRNAWAEREARRAAAPPPPPSAARHGRARDRRRRHFRAPSQAFKTGSATWS